MSEISLKERILGGLWGAVIGDALGVPVEFKSREEVRKNPVTAMRGYGTFNLPPGSWSDDSSLMLCTVESLLNGFNTDLMGQLFIKWLKDSYWTPWGEVFDVGGATRKGIKRIMRGTPPEKAGGVSEDDNGNGSLMRILPIGLYFSNSPVQEILEHTQRASSLTHRHIRSQMACGFYCLMAASLMKGLNPLESYLYAMEEFLSAYDNIPYANELSHFDQILTDKIHELPENRIHSGGYVIHTLETSIWCLLNSGSYKEAVLKAVNLGEDTDTTGIVTGGLAGIAYGINAIPGEWIDIIVKKDEIGDLFERFCDCVTTPLCS